MKTKRDDDESCVPKTTTVSVSGIKGVGTRPLMEGGSLEVGFTPPFAQVRVASKES